MVLRFSLTEETGSFDALATALRRESGAAIVYLNEQQTIETQPAGASLMACAITMLVKGENEAVDTAMMWLDRLVGTANIDYLVPSVAAATLFQNGVEARRTGNNEMALEWFDRIIAIDDSLSRAWINRANTLSDLGRREEARASYERAVAINPADAIAHFNFATLLANTGDLASAQAELREAVRIAPELEPARRALEKIDELVRSSESTRGDP